MYAVSSFDTTSYKIRPVKIKISVTRNGKIYCEPESSHTTDPDRIS